MSLVTALLALAACGSVPATTPTPSASLPPYDGPAGFLPASLIAGDGNTPTMQWGDAARADASLRQLFIGYIDAVSTGNYESAKANFLTSAGLEKTLAGCTAGDEAARFKACFPTPVGNIVIQNVRIVDELHAELTYVRYDENAKASAPTVVPVLLTGRGPRFEDGSL